MSYVTWLNVKVLNFKEDDDHKKITKELCEAADLSCCECDEDSFAGEDNNRCGFEQLIKASKKYPHIIIEADVDASGEDGNRWYSRIRNGKFEENDVRLVYPTFRKILTPAEKAAIKAPANLKPADGITEACLGSIRLALSDVRRAIKRLDGAEINNTVYCLRDNLHSALEAVSNAFLTATGVN